ncbi:hypothetical protein [Gabonibacter chumensis]|uniref:hypothetical protein n=1 Tax=Gabonibacter chumensis TaxID=2972474 RepID=UPI002573D30B|nr:hypothetical protein [Gabonibacter chumensis]MCR9011626.1 hypothetical protein [Gabonibacter chumensis]
MKNAGLFILLFIGILFNVNAQERESIFSFEGGEIIEKGRFLDSLYIGRNLDNITYKLVGNVFVSNREQELRVILGSYFEGELEDFNEIMLRTDNDTIPILKIKQIDGWVKIPKEFRTYATNDFFIPIYVNNTTVALVFFGCVYNSEPPLLTIVIIHNGKAKMVFNKPFIVKEIREIEGKTYFLLYDRFFEYVSGDEPVNEAVMYGIWNENGVLYFGGPYGTTKQ